MYRVNTRELESSRLYKNLLAEICHLALISNNARIYLAKQDQAVSYMRVTIKL